MQTTRLSDQEGAVAVTVAVTILALIGTAMLAIDGGAMWSSRRNLITDTDAAALAAAHDLVLGSCDLAGIAQATGIAQSVLTDNDASSVLSSPVSITCGDWAGRVLVAATRNTALTFGGLAGIPDVDIASTSLAQYGQIGIATGVRPMAICNKDPHVLEFARDNGYIDDAGIIALLGGQAGIDLLAAVDLVAADLAEHPKAYDDPRDKKDTPVNYHDTDRVHRVYFSRAAMASGCSGANGNWGWLDFDGDGGGSGGNGNAQVSEWIESGYDQPITVGPPDECAPEVTEDDNCIGEPGGGGNSWDDSLETIRCPPEFNEAQCVYEQRLAFPIILFDGNVCTDPGKCAGANARYDPDAFLGVILRNWSPVTGKPDDFSYFDFQFIDRFVTTGTITGTAPGVGPGIVGIQLCGGGANALTDDLCTVTAP